MSDVQNGKAKRLITELSKHNFDDANDWNVGVADLLRQYDYEPGVVDEIKKLAVAERIASQENAAVKAYRQAVNSQA